MNGGREAPPPQIIRTETRSSPVIIYKNTHSHVHTRTHARAHRTSCDSTRELRNCSVNRLSSSGQSSLFYAHFPSLLPISAVTGHYDGGSCHRVYQNPPAPTHKNITVWPDRTSSQQYANSANLTVYKFCLIHHAKEYSSFECVYVSEIAWHLLSVPYIQNNLHKRTIVILIGLDRCRGGEKGTGRRSSAMVSYGLECDRWGGGGSGCQDGKKRTEVQEGGLGLGI